MVNPALPSPLHPKHLIYMFFECFQGQQLQYFPGQPVPMSDPTFHEELFLIPNLDLFWHSKTSHCSDWLAHSFGVAILPLWPKHTQAARWSIQVSVPKCGTDAPLLLVIIQTISNESSEGSLRIWPLKDGLTQVTIHLCHRQQWTKAPLLGFFFQITHHLELLLLDQVTNLTPERKVT